MLRSRAAAPAGALIDPGAEDPDFGGGQARAHGRHDHLAFQSGDHADQFAIGAVPGADHAHGAGLLIQPQAFHLLLRAVAQLAAGAQ